jgi:chorismate synthase
MLRFFTAGESHGPALVGILEGLPAGLSVDFGFINNELARRQKGYGRGGRMKIEQDKIKILSGVRHQKTLGSPVAFEIANLDWENWKNIMNIEGTEPNPQTEEEKKKANPSTAPRPGHADLAGAIKYNQSDIRNILERASARETATRTACGAFAKLLLKKFDIRITSHVIDIGGERLQESERQAFDVLSQKAEGSPVRAIDPDLEERMMAKIDKAIQKKDTVGGVFEVVATGIPVGLGSYVHWDRKLDGQLAAAVMSIHSVKGVEIGAGFRQAGMFGSQVHDQIFYDTIKPAERKRTKFFYRQTNNAGGLEGGVTNGEDIVIRGCCKPLSTLMQPLKTVDIRTKEQKEAIVERSDVCVVPTYGIVAESMVALVLASAFMEKFGGDNMEEIEKHYQMYLESVF